jgi:hypothetical protein
VPVWSRTFKRVAAGRPFTCQVPVAALTSGGYLLKIDGYSLETSAPVEQEVRFVYDPDLK